MLTLIGRVSDFSGDRCFFASLSPLAFGTLDIRDCFLSIFRRLVERSFGTGFRILRLCI
jgi:hypothetical protein